MKEPDVNIARDPITGRPLHEFVVDPLVVPPTALPTEGTPIDEPGTTAHQSDRGTPRIIITVDPKLKTEIAAAEVVRLIRQADQDKS